MPAQHSRSLRKRLTAATAVAVLAVGGLTACGPEEPTVTKSSPSSAKSEGKDDGNDGKGEDAKKDGPLAAGDTATYSSGLSVTVSEATAHTPGQYAIGHTEGNKAYKVTVTLENTGEKKIDTDLILLSARAGEEGVEAEQIFDDEVGSGFQGKLLPGKKATAVYAFDAPADAENLDVEVDLVDFTTEPAQWGLTL
ncbi:MAG TPA: DUF4352 domain-containing protein [Streptomyces sp.]|nr:DUF4352 domain-containing protein [Streptomyces sp.]